MGIKVSAGLRSHPNTLWRNPCPGSRFLVVSTQFLAAAGLRYGVPASCQQGALSEIQAPTFLLTVPSTFTRPRRVQPSWCLRQPQAGPPHSSPAGPPLVPSPPALCKWQGDSVSLSTPGMCRFSLPPLRGLWAGAPSELVPGPEAPGSLPGLRDQGPKWMEPGPLLTCTVLT